MLGLRGCLQLLWQIVLGVCALAAALLRLPALVVRRRALQSCRRSDEAAPAAPPPQLPPPPGYSPALERLRATDFGQRAGKVYADYAGAPPYADSVLRQAMQDLLGGLYGNPHSSYGWAQHVSEAAEARVRQLTLALCRADPQQYECVLTSGATGALKLVGESFGFGPGGAFFHLRDNHNSVLGLRQLAAQRGAAAAAVEVAAFEPGAEAGHALTLRLCSGGGGDSSDADAAPLGSSNGIWGASDSNGSGASGEARHLFALPLESNMWGVRYDERLVEAVQQGRFQLAAAAGGSEARPPPPGRWRVLLDAAKAAASAPPNLSAHPADFVALSFYKLFGYPTGVGALLVRRDALGELAAGKAYFGGGTVAVSLAEEAFFRRRPGAAGLEDGTLPFLSLPAVLRGFAFLDRCGGLPTVAAHASAVARHLAERLTAAQHANGAPLCVLYGAWPGAHGPQQAAAAGQQQPGLEGLGQAISRSKGLRRTQVLRHGQRQGRSGGGGSRRGSGEGASIDGSVLSGRANMASSRAGSVASESPRGGEIWDPAWLLADGPRPSSRGSSLDSGGPPAAAAGAVGPRLSHSQLLEQAGVAGQGPVVAFNVLRPNGSYVGYREVEKLGSLHGIFLRTGCMCNPGACAAALGLAPAEMKANYAAGHVCWDDHDVIGGKPTGLVRASFGYASTLADADAIVELLVRYFLEGAEAEAAEATAASPTVAAQSPKASPPSPHSVLPPLPTWPDTLPSPAAPAAAEAGQWPAEGAAALGNGMLSPGSGLAVEGIWLYPIKSCRGQQARAWPLGPTGLLYDRHWVLVDGSGAALTLRKCPALATIQPEVDLMRGVLRVAADGVPGPPLELPLPGATHSPPGALPGDADGSDGSGAEALSIRVCSREACAQSSATVSSDAAAVSRWFDRALGVPCRLVQQLGVGAAGGSGSSSIGDGAAAAPDSQLAPPPQHQQHAEQGQGPAPAPGAELRSFANEAQLLVLSNASLADLYARSGAGRGSSGSSSSGAPTGALSLSAGSLADFTRRFRPNLVLGGPGAEPYCEDGWARVAVGGGAGTGPSAVVLASAGGCPRCNMVCMDPYTGRQEGPEPLLTLAGYRRKRGAVAKGGGGGKICFGVLFNKELAAPAELGGDAAHGQHGRQQQQEEYAEEWVASSFRPYVAVGMAVEAQPWPTDS